MACRECGIGTLATGLLPLMWSRLRLSSVKWTLLASPLNTPKLPDGVNVVSPTGAGSSIWFWLNVVLLGSGGNCQRELHSALQPVAGSVGSEAPWAYQPVDWCKVMLEPA